jgi:hypothetical protein
MPLGINQAFGLYGAKLKNKRWSVAAKAKDGSIVISCWQHLFKPGLVYADRLSRWQGNVLGNGELRALLEEGYRDQTPVRLVMAVPKDKADLIGVWDASKVAKEFFVRRDRVGRITEFDGDGFKIEFTPTAAQTVP